MRQLYAFLVLGLYTASQSFAQSASDYAVQLQATTQVSPPQITLQWKKLSGAVSYVVARKGKDDLSFSNLATLPATDSSYTDASIIVDSAYEYRVSKTGGSNTATGFIYAGIKAPPIHERGVMILLVDSTFRDSCHNEIAQLMFDLRADGWGIVRRDISRNTPVPSVRGIIQTEYNSRSNVKGLYLLGHIPVAYSGNLYPDGHTDHQGGWPADGYYGDVDGNWTDISVNSSSATRPQNRNIPGDGKWDHDFLPSPVDLQMGRVDFANMPAITRSEIQLMRNYLNKAHRYKVDSLAILRKGIIDDNFGAFGGEAFAANAWRLYPTVVSSMNIVAADLQTSLNDSAYQWAYGCGGGNYMGASGIGSTSDFNTKAAKGIFTMMFGSYFGDWDAQNSFLRAPLCATEPALTSAWAGRPNWFLHHMALGESIGYSAKTSHNNTTLYTPANYGGGFVHVGLMGDPSLRTDYMLQPTGLVITPLPSAGASLSWNGSADPNVIGYYVYRSDSVWGTYSKISVLLSSTSFNDTKGTDGKKYYMVRGVKLQPTPSGSYYNLGLGIVDSGLITYPLSVSHNSNRQQLVLYPNPATNRLNAVVETMQEKQASLQILNASGSLLHSEQVALRSGTNSLSWDVSAYPAGFYTLVLRTEQGVLVRKWTRTESK